MKPAQFTFHAPDRLDELLALLADDEAEARVIAGGQSLVPMMNFRLSTPEVLIDLRRVAELGELRLLDDGALHVGASVTQARLLRAPETHEHFPLLAEGVGHIGHPQIRSRGTVCGSLAHCDPTAELPALALALDARMTIRSAAHGARELTADEFLVSYYESALEPGEMLAATTFAPLPAGAGWSFRELARRRGDFALVGAAAVVAPGAHARVVLFGVGDRARRMTAVEELLAGERDPGPELLARVPELVAAAVDPADDVHASAEYRRELAGQLAVATITEALERAAA